MKLDALSPTIVLVRPREQGNIGATARAMANMGLEESPTPSRSAPATSSTTL
jgi:hypothetical protein